MIVDQLSLDPGHRTTQQPAGGVEQDDLGLRLGLHLGEHAGQGRLHEDATDNPVAEQDRARRRQRARRRPDVADVLVRQRVVVAPQDRLHHGLTREIGPALEDEAARVGRVRLADFEDGLPAGVEDHHSAQAVVHFEGHDQPAKGRGVAGADRLVDPLGIGDQTDRRHLAALELDRGVQRRVLGMHQLVGDAVLQRRCDQAGCQVGADHAQDQHQEQKRQDDLGTDPQGRQG